MRQTNEGQLRPLQKRLSMKHQIRRAAKLVTRERSRAILIGRLNQAYSVLNRPLLGRLKWALFGR